jgi:hypothetical protein
MAQKPTFEELEKRIRQAFAHHRGSLPRDAALAWSGYLAALIEWGLISVDEHSRLLGLLPTIADNPATQILLGYDS